MKLNIKSLAAFLAIAAAPLFSACTDEALVEHEVVEFGTEGEKLYTVDAPAGQIVFNLLSNQHCTMRLDQEYDWVELNGDVIDKDGEFYIKYGDNEGFPRMAKIIVDAPGVALSDTIVVRQRGLNTPNVTLASGTMILNGAAAGTASEGMTTNLDFSTDVKAQVAYTGGEGTDWVTGVTATDGKLNIQFNPNPSQTPRTARLDLLFDNGWGETETTTIFLTQKNNRDELGTVVGFDKIRSLAKMSADVKIKDYYIISGYVVSAKENRNAGENPNTTPTSIDYSICDRTVYFESEDGKYGFNIVMDTKADNVFDRYDKVQLLLKDATLHAENDPYRYTITNINTTNIVGRVAGTAGSIPVKEKYIDELTDDDMYTYVTLKDCEVAVRKGPLTPIHDGYTLAMNAHRISKYPRLIIDNRGNDIYLYTNTTCPYRRDGKKLPYGAGDLCGVIVFEYCKSLVYGDGDDEETHGRIGRYQIRHMSYDDIRMSQNDNDAKNGLLTEYRYINKKTLVADENRSYWYPTYGNNGRFYNSCSRYPAGCYAVTNWNYLGWTGTASGIAPFKNHVGDDKKSGTGIILENGTNYRATDGKHNTDGKGQRLNTDGDSWCSRTFFDSDGNGGYTPNSWIIEVSTAGITTNHLTMQISAQGPSATELTCPTYWRACWSESNDLTDDSHWKKIGDYQVPDFPIWANYHEWQHGGFKHMNFNLPLEMLGKQKVYIRLYPILLKANTTYGFSAGTIKDPLEKCYNALEYFAIRYAK